MDVPICNFLEIASTLRTLSAIRRKAHAVAPRIPCHVTQRGSNRQPVFFRIGDRKLYLQLIRENQDEAGISRAVMRVRAALRGRSVRARVRAKGAISGHVARRVSQEANLDVWLLRLSPVLSPVSLSGHHLMHLSTDFLFSVDGSTSTAEPRPKTCERRSGRIMTAIRSPGSMRSSAAF